MFHLLYVFFSIAVKWSLCTQIHLLYVRLWERDFCMYAPICESKSFLWPLFSNPWTSTYILLIPPHLLSICFFFSHPVIFIQDVLLNPTRPNPFNLLFSSCLTDWSSVSYGFCLVQPRTSAQQLFVSAGPNLKNFVLPIQTQAVVVWVFGVSDICAI